MDRLLTRDFEQLHVSNNMIIVFTPSKAREFRCFIDDLNYCMMFFSEQSHI